MFRRTLLYYFALLICFQKESEWNQVAAFVPPAVHRHYGSTALTSITSTQRLHALFRSSSSQSLQHNVQELASESTVIGTMHHITTKLGMLSSTILTTTVNHVVYWKELSILAFFGWAFVPLVTGMGVIPKKRRKQRLPYVKLFFRTLAQLSRIGFVVYLVDIMVIVLYALGIQAPMKQNWSEFVSKSMVRTQGITTG